MFPTISTISTPHTMLLAKAEKKKSDLDDIYILPRSSHETCLAEYDKLNRKLEDNIKDLKVMRSENASDISLINRIMSSNYSGLAGISLQDRLRDVLFRQHKFRNKSIDSLNSIKEFIRDCGHTLPIDQRATLQVKSTTLEGLLEIRPDEAAVLERVRNRKGLAQDILNMVKGLLAPWPASSQPGRFAPPTKLFE